MSAHTPGPWQVDPRHPIDVQTADGRQEVCTPFYPGCEGRTIRPATGIASLSEAYANARLIAAAPELLEACEKALAWMQSTSSFAAAEMILAEAIAKAKGEA